MSKADNKELEEAIKVLQKISIEIDRIFYALHANDPKKAKEKNEIKVALKELKRLQKDYIAKDKIREKIESETIDISGLKLIAIKDLEELLEENKSPEGQIVNH